MIEWDVSEGNDLNLYCNLDSRGLLDYVWYNVSNSAGKEPLGFLRSLTLELNDYIYVSITNL